MKKAIDKLDDPKLYKGLHTSTLIKSCQDYKDAQGEADRCFLITTKYLRSLNIDFIEAFGSNYSKLVQVKDPMGTESEETYYVTGISGGAFQLQSKEDPSDTPTRRILMDEGLLLEVFELVIQTRSK